MQTTLLVVMFRHDTLCGLALYQTVAHVMILPVNIMSGDKEKAVISYDCIASHHNVASSDEQNPIYEPVRD